MFQKNLTILVHKGKNGQSSLREVRETTTYSIKTPVNSPKEPALKNKPWTLIVVIKKGWKKWARVIYKNKNKLLKRGEDEKNWTIHTSCFSENKQSQRYKKLKKKKRMT